MPGSAVPSSVKRMAIFIHKELIVCIVSDDYMKAKQLMRLTSASKRVDVLRKYLYVFPERSVIIAKWIY